MPLLPPLCRRCGYPSQTTLCKTCRYSPPPFDQARSWARYGGPLKNAILVLKREENRRLARVFAEAMFSVLCYTSWDIDLIVPIPLSKDRFKDRGFNQAELVGDELAAIADIPLRTTALLRFGQNPFQASFKAADRRRNQSGVFVASKKQVEGNRVLLIDDVYASGATLQEASLVVRKAKARAIFALTIAMSLLHSRM